jgi:predicted GTPase
MGYSPKEIKDLEITINKVDCDVVVSATPTNLRNIININKPIVQVGYELKPRTDDLDKIIKKFASGVKK